MLARYILYNYLEQNNFMISQRRITYIEPRAAYGRRHQESTEAELLPAYGQTIIFCHGEHETAEPRLWEHGPINSGGDTSRGGKCPRHPERVSVPSREACDSGCGTSLPTGQGGGRKVEGHIRDALASLSQSGGGGFDAGGEALQRLLMQQGGGLDTEGDAKIRGAGVAR